MREQLRRFLRTFTLVGVVIAVMAATPAAFADPPDESGVVVRGPDLSGIVYYGDGLHVLTGPPLEQGCLGEGFVTPTAQFVFRPNGTTSHHMKYTDGVLVFDDMGITDFFEWIDMACTAILDGDPTTVAPEPLATGVGEVVFHLRVDSDSVVHVHNKVVARLLTSEGRQVHLSTFAKFHVGPDGPVFQQLRINYGGS